jgi:hypothetical protein
MLRVVRCRPSILPPQTRELAHRITNFDGDGQRIQNRKVQGNDNLSTFEIHSSVLGGAVIGTIKKDINHPNDAQPYEFGAPAIDGTLKWNVGLLDEMANFEWTAPEGLISKGEPLDLRGADVEWSSPYEHASGEAGGSYPAFPDASNPGRCAFVDGPMSCSLEEKFEQEYDRVKGIIDSKKKNAGSGPTGVAHEAQHSHNAMRTKSTNKPADAPSSAQTVASASSPSASGHGPNAGNAGDDSFDFDAYHQIDPTTVDVKIDPEGPDIVAVDATAGMMDQPLQTRKLPDDATLRKSVVDLTSHCTDFLNSFLAILDKKSGKAHRNSAGKFDIGANFDRIGKKLVDSGDGKLFRSASGVAKGLSYVDDGVRVIVYRPFSTDVAYSVVTLAELLHHSREKGTYSDAALDSAMKSLVGEAAFKEERDRMKEQYKGHGGYPVGGVAHSFISNKCQ